MKRVLCLMIGIVLLTSCGNNNDDNELSKTETTTESSVEEKKDLSVLDVIKSNDVENEKTTQDDVDRYEVRYDTYMDIEPGWTIQEVIEYLHMDPDDIEIDEEQEGVLYSFYGEDGNSFIKCFCRGNDVIMTSQHGLSDLVTDFTGKDIGGIRPGARHFVIAQYLEQDSFVIMKDYNELGEIQYYHRWTSDPQSTDLDNGIVAVFAVHDASRSIRYPGGQWYSY